jgi:DNA-binding transcriptional ArsR family regulator
MADAAKKVPDLDRVIHEPARLTLVALLYAVEEADFLYLLRETGLTKGNLSSHLMRLEEAGYVEIAKSYRGKVPQTICHLTSEGRKAFEVYRSHIRSILPA